MEGIEKELNNFDKKASKNIVKESNVLLDGISEKLGINISENFMNFVKNKKLSSDEFISLLKTLKERKPKELKK